MLHMSRPAMTDYRMTFSVYAPNISDSSRSESPLPSRDHQAIAIIFVPAITSTMARIFCIVGLPMRLLPYSAPAKPPITAAAAHSGKAEGKTGADAVMPSRAEIELTRINAAAMPEMIFTLAHRKYRRSGLKNIPPPTPVSPERSPRTAPAKNSTEIFGRPAKICAD